MQTDNRLFDDLARLAGGAFSSLTALKDEAESRLHAQFEYTLSRIDLVRRDEFDAVRAIAIRVDNANRVLEGRIEALERQLGSPEKNGNTDATLGQKKPRVRKKRSLKQMNDDK